MLKVIVVGHQQLIPSACVRRSTNRVVFCIGSFARRVSEERSSNRLDLPRSITAQNKIVEDPTIRHCLSPLGDRFAAPAEVWRIGARTAIIGASTCDPGSRTRSNPDSAMTDAARPNEKTEPIRSPELLSAENSRLLIVDVQEKLLALIPVAERLTHNCRRLLDGAKILSVPAFGTEQYPQGLGRTTPQLAERLGPLPSKVAFSCVPVLEWGEAAQLADDRDQVVVAGMETHVCVLQTVFDLIAAGFRVYVPADAVASRSEMDWRIALDRMASSGATVTTVESVLFEWCQKAGTPAFKEIQKLIIEG
jgi:nicotinamidase-related amidase